MSFILKVPTHLDGRNPVVGRYTARELVPVVAGAFGATGVLGQPRLAAPVRVGEALAVVALGGAAGLVRPGGRSLLAWGRLAAMHALAERASAWTPPSMPTSPHPLMRPSDRRTWRSRRVRLPLCALPPRHRAASRARPDAR